MTLVYESPPTEIENRMPKSKTVGFRPPKDLEERLESAQAVTGKDLSHLVIRCVEGRLDEVVAEEVEKMKDEFAQRQKAAREFLKPKKAA